MFFAGDPPSSFRIEDFSEEDILEHGIELWDGILQRKPAADDVYTGVSLRLIGMLAVDLCEREDLAFCGDSEHFILHRGPDRFLSPFAAIHPSVQPRQGDWLLGPPIIAVELVYDFCPRSIAERKRRWWLEAGAEQVWLITPAMLALEVHEPGGRMSFHQDKIFTGSGTVEGLEFHLGQLLSRGNGGD